MKLLKTTKTLLLSGALLFGAFDVLDAAANKAEEKYQSLLKAGKYDDLDTFLGRMVKRVGAQYDKAVANAEEIANDDFADEMEIETAQGQVTIMQNAKKFWEQRLAAVKKLQETSVEDEAKYKQIAAVLPTIRQMIAEVKDAKHNANGKSVELKQYIDANAEFIKSMPELKDKVPKIKFESAVSAVMAEQKLEAFGTAVEAKLRELEKAAAANKAALTSDAEGVERDSNTKKKKRGKKKAAAE